MNRPVILAVDDDQKILRLLRLELSAQGYQVDTATSGDEAIEIFQQRRPDLLILDILLPGTDGLEVLRQVREHSTIPIILLSAKGTDVDRIAGLQHGADDYVTKPFSPEELAARVRAVLRRAQAREGTTAGERIVCGDIVVDLGRRTVFVAGRPVVLSRTEWQLLQQFCTNAGRVLLHEDLLTRTWGAEYRDDVQYLRVWISRLRQKIEDDPAAPRYIRTVQGIGYVMDGTPSAS